MDSYRNTLLRGQVRCGEAGSTAPLPGSSLQPPILQRPGFGPDDRRFHRIAGMDADLPEPGNLSPLDPRAMTPGGICFVASPMAMKRSTTAGTCGRPRTPRTSGRMARAPDPSFHVVLHILQIAALSRRRQQGFECPQQHPGRWRTALRRSFLDRESHEIRHSRCRHPYILRSLSRRDVGSLIPWTFSPYTACRQIFPFETGQRDIEHIPKISGNRRFTWFGALLRTFSNN